MKIQVSADTDVSLRVRVRVTNMGPAGTAGPASPGAAWPLLLASARGSLVKEAGMWALAS